MNHLKFRRQFLLTKKELDQLPENWKNTTINCQHQIWYLYSHPDLAVTKVEDTNHTLVLVGYFVDPFHPEHSNEEILNHLVVQPDSDHIIEKTHFLNGRFLLFYINDDDFIIFNDATCFRELYYLIDNSDIHCGSTPDIINSFIGARLSENKEIFDFFNSKTYATNDHTWIGYETIFNNLKKLPPNHFLDVKTHLIKRFWPLKPLQKLKPGDIAIECAEYLRGCLQSISNRHPVHLGVTAGWDSRLLLAASKNLKQSIFYYINIHSKLSNDHPDIRISEILSKILGFKINKIYLDNDIDRNFSEIYYNNNFRANNVLLPVFYYGYINKFDETITVSGNLAEGTARQYFLSPLKIDKINSANFLEFISFGESPYAIRILNEWIEEAKKLCKLYNIDIFNLYQIEMEASNWCNLSSSEQDIIREEMRPFNSRYLISLFWSIDSKYKFKKNPAIYKMMMKYLWKETLQVPVNPSFKNSIANILNYLKLDICLYKLSLKLKYLIK